MTNSYLYLVDLAGSERVKKTKAVEMRLEEAKKINFSLLTLGKCINALAEGNTTFISYRESVLTRLLQESLGGNAKTSLIVTVSPSSYNADETVSSLNFAQRAMKVKNKPIQNVSVDYHALYIKLQEDFDKLNDQYAELEQKYEKLQEENQKLKSGETYVELQKKSLNQNFGDNNINNNNDNGMRSNNKYGINNINSKIKTPKEIFKEEIKKMEAIYKGIIKNKVEEYENVLKDIDKMIFEKEQTIEKLVEDNKILNNKNRTNQEIIKKKKKKELDSLNAQIELLEKKIIPLENNNLLNSNSINLVQNKIDNKIVFLNEEKEELMNSITDLTNKLNYEQESRGKKSEEEHKKELDSLNAQIEENNFLK